MTAPEASAPSTVFPAALHQPDQAVEVPEYHRVQRRPDGLPYWALPDPDPDGLVETSSSPYSLHRVANYRRCPRLYAHETLIPRPPEGNNSRATDRGTLGHAGLSARYLRLACEQRGLDPNRYATPEDAIWITANRWAANWPERAHIIDGYRDDALAAYASYAEEREREQLTVLGAEQIIYGRFKGADGRRWVWTQRADLIVLGHRSGRGHIVDHKFLTEYGRRTAMRYSLSWQFVGYRRMGGPLFGSQAGGPVINATTWEEGTNRQHVWYVTKPAPNAVADYEATQVDAMERICAAHDKLAAGVSPRRVFLPVLDEQTCIGPYGTCKHYDDCHGTGTTAR